MRSLVRYVFVGTLCIAGVIHANKERESIEQADYPIIDMQSVVIAELDDMLPNSQTSNNAIYRSQDAHQYIEWMPIEHDLPVPSDVNISERSALVETSAATRSLYPSPCPIRSFQAMEDAFIVIPPDTQGAVGLNHVVTTLNDRVRIQDKQGAILRTVPLRAFCGLTSAEGPFDPKITYDPYANRWIFTCGVNPRSANSQVLISVSQTNDPLGAWHIFKVKTDPSSVSAADFPSLGFNGKWAVVQVNMIGITTNSRNSKVFVFDKNKLYTGVLGTVKVFSLNNSGETQAPAVTYDPTFPTMYLVQNWNGGYNGKGFLRLYAINGAVGSETLTTVGYPTINQPWKSEVTSFNGGFAPQLGTDKRIEQNDGRIAGVVFRNGSLWATHAVFLPPSPAAPTHTIVQWWNISQTADVLQFGRIEDPAANLNAGSFYAYPSIAVNARNDVLIGYARFNPLMHPNGAYSFRLGTDEPNTMRDPTMLKAGVAVYTKDYGTGRIRWGDYSSTVVDPSNDIDMWTLQEYADALVNGQSAWGTWWGLINPRLTT